MPLHCCQYCLHRISNLIHGNCNKLQHIRRRLVNAHEEGKLWLRTLVRCLPLPTYTRRVKANFVEFFQCTYTETSKHLAFHCWNTRARTTTPVTFASVWCSAQLFVEGKYIKEFCSFTGASSSNMCMWREKVQSWTQLFHHNRTCM